MANYSIPLPSGKSITVQADTPPPAEAVQALINQIEPPAAPANKKKPFYYVDEEGVGHIGENWLDLSKEGSAGVAMGAALKEMPAVAAGAAAYGTAMQSPMVRTLMGSPSMPAKIAGHGIALGTALLGSMAGGKAVDVATEAVMPEVNAQLKKEQSENPDAARLGALAAQVPFFKPSLAGISLAERARSSAINTGIAGAMELQNGLQEGATNRLVDAAISGAIFTHPTQVGEAVTNFGAAGRPMTPITAPAVDRAPKFNQPIATPDAITSQLGNVKSGDAGKNLSEVVGKVNTTATSDFSGIVPTGDTSTGAGQTINLDAGTAALPERHAFEASASTPSARNQTEAIVADTSAPRAEQTAAELAFSRKRASDSAKVFQIQEQINELAQQRSALEIEADRQRQAQIQQVLNEGGQFGGFTGTDVAGNRNAQIEAESAKLTDKIIKLEDQLRDLTGEQADARRKRVEDEARAKAQAEHDARIKAGQRYGLGDTSGFQPVELKGSMAFEDTAPKSGEQQMTEHQAFNQRVADAQENLRNEGIEIDRHTAVQLANAASNPSEFNALRQRIIDAHRPVNAIVPKKGPLKSLGDLPGGTPPASEPPPSPFPSPKEPPSAPTPAKPVTPTPEAPKPAPAPETPKRSAELEAAIKRRNVDKDGRLWNGSNGEDATPDNVIKHIGIAQDNIDRRYAQLELVERAKKLNPDANVSEVRAVDYIDSSARTYDDIIRTIKSRIADSAQYKKDIIAAGDHYKSLHPDAKETGTVKEHVYDKNKDYEYQELEKRFLKVMREKEHVENVITNTQRNELEYGLNQFMKDHGIVITDNAKGKTVVLGSRNALKALASQIMDNYVTDGHLDVHASVRKSMGNLADSLRQKAFLGEPAPKTKVADIVPVETKPLPEPVSTTSTASSAAPIAPKVEPAPAKAAAKQNKPSKLETIYNNLQGAVDNLEGKKKVLSIIRKAKKEGFISEADVKEAEMTAKDKDMSEYDVAAAVRYSLEESLSAAEKAKTEQPVKKVVAAKKVEDIKPVAKPVEAEKIPATQKEEPKYEPGYEQTKVKAGGFTEVIYRLQEGAGNPWYANINGKRTLLSDGSIEIAKKNLKDMLNYKNVERQNAAERIKNMSTEEAINFAKETIANGDAKAIEVFNRVKNLAGDQGRILIERAKDWSDALNLTKYYKDHPEDYSLSQKIIARNRERKAYGALMVEAGKVAGMSMEDIYALKDYVADEARLSKQNVKAPEDKSGMKSEAGFIVKPSFTQIATKAFKEWFGNSKVVDNEGLPLVVAHGTSSPSKFVSFDTNMQMGAHFATNAEIPNMYAGIGNGARVYGVHLKIENPWISRDLGRWGVDDFAHEWTRQWAEKNKIDPRSKEFRQYNQKTLDEIFNDPSYPLHERDGSTEAKAIQNFLKKRGYDGIQYLNRFEVMKPGESSMPAVRSADVQADNRLGLTDEQFKEKYPDASTSYIIFDPSQAKAYRGNSGKYDKMTDDIGGFIVNPFDGEMTPLSRKALEILNEPLLKGMARHEVQKAQAAELEKMYAPWSPSDKVEDSEPVAKTPMGDAMDNWKVWNEANADTPIGDLVRKMGTVIDNVRAIYPPAAGAIRNMLQSEMTRSSKLYDLVMPPLAKLRSAVGKEEFENLGRALRNGHEEAVLKHIEKNVADGKDIADGLRNGWMKVRDELHTAYEEAHPTSKIGRLDNYWPSTVYDVKALRRALGRADEANVAKALREAQIAKNERTGTLQPLTKNEEAAAMVNLLDNSRRFPSKVGNLKERKVMEVDAEMSKHYEPIDVALTRYIERMSRDIAQGEFLGKISEGSSSPWINSDESSMVGSIIAKGLREKKISAAGAEAITENINALLNRPYDGGKMGGIIRTIGAVQTIGNLGQITNAIPQIFDAFQIAHNTDSRSAASGMVKATKTVLGRKEGTLADIGVREGNFETNQYARGSGKIDRATDFVLNPFFKPSDKLGKEALLEAIKMWSEKNVKAEQPSDKFINTIQRYEQMFGKEEVAALRDGIAKAEWARPELKRFLFNYLSDIQPISRGDMPLGMLQASGFGKIPWRLTSFTLRQLGRARDNVITNYRQGNKWEAAGWAASYAIWSMIGNSLLQYTRDIVNGKEKASFGDYGFGSLVQLVGVNRNQLVQGITHNGVMSMVGERMLPGIGGVLNDVTADTKTLAQLVTGRQTFDSARSELVKRLPWVGSTYYNWAGAGKDRELMKERQRKNQSDLETIGKAILGGDTRPTRR